MQQKSYMPTLEILDQLNHIFKTDQFVAKELASSFA